MFFGNDPTAASFFVIDRDADQLSGEIRDLRRDLESPTFTFEGVRWELLTSSLNAKQEPTAETQETGLVIATPALPQLFVDGTPDRPSSFEAFMAEGGEAIRAHGDERLSRAIDELARTVKGASDHNRQAADYYAQFLPHVAPQTAEVPLVRRLLQSVLETLRTLLKASRGVAEGTWAVLRDPDGAYLRYRGEIEEYARIRGADDGLIGLLTFVPDLFRLYVRLLLDDRVAKAVKFRVLGGLAYLVLPVDLIPDGLPAGLADDALVLACTLTELLDEHAVAKELPYEHWVGPRHRLDDALKATRFLREDVPFFRELFRTYRAMRGRGGSAA